MRGLTLTGIVVAIVTTLVVAIAWFTLLGPSFGAVSSIDSNSMSHGPEDMEGVLDPGEWRRLEPIDGPEDLVTFYEGREQGHRVGEDYGDVVAYRPNGTEPASTVPRIFPGMDDDGATMIEHRVLAWVTYNASADAYDVPELGIQANRSFQLPGVGSYDPQTETYVHRDLEVRLDPEEAGRHDGYLTKGDHNPAVDQDTRTDLASTGSVELVPHDRIEGKLAAHVDSGTILAFQLGVPIVALLSAGGVYAWRRGHLDAVLPDIERGEEGDCSACGHPMDAGTAFCPSCGERRGEG